MYNDIYKQKRTYRRKINNNNNTTSMDGFYMFDIFARTELLRPDLEDMQSRLCVLRLDLLASSDSFPRNIRQIVEQLITEIGNTEDNMDLLLDYLEEKEENKK